MKQSVRWRGWISAASLFSLSCGAASAAAIDRFAPAQGPPGTQVSIMGSGLANTTQVRFDTVPADFTVLSAGQIIAVVPQSALSGPISVTGTSPADSFTTSGFFLVAPRVFEFLPARAATNTTVNIFGENFEAATNVWFGAANAAFTIVGSQQIAATVPFGATNGPLRVEAIGGSATTGSDFIVTGPAPIIDSFSPATVAPGGTVLIEGANFVGVTSVAVNNLSLQPVAVTAQSQIHATVPANAALGTGPIRVTTSGGTTTSTDSLLITRAPVITDFTPEFGASGQEVIISGINFNNVTGVTFNGITTPGFGTPAENQINAIVPATATTGPIRVSNSFGFGLSAKQFVVTRAPIITGFDQSFVNPGQNLVVRGANFQGATLVRFVGRDAAPSVVSDGQLNVIVPGGATTGPVTIFNAFGTNTTSPILVISGGAPYVTDVSPAFGPRGTVVQISGANLASVSSVRFNGVSAALTVVADTQLRAVVPPPATSGFISITSPGGANTNQFFFFVPPRLTSFTPASGVVGDSIALTGTNFLGATEVTLGGMPVPFVVASTNAITATIVSDTRSGVFTVRAPGGNIIGTNRFTVLPRILSFSPMLGPVETQVTITGTSFFDVQSVRFNNTAATAFAVRSREEIVATVPTGATTGPIHVTTLDGTAASTESFLVTGTSDLAVTQTVSHSLAPPGQILTYSLEVANFGPSVQTGVTVTDTLPLGARFIGADSSRGFCAVTNGVVTCTLGVVTNNTSAQITIQAQLDAEGVFTNRVTASAVEPDSNASNNSAQAVTVVVSRASRTLQIQKSANTNSVVLTWPVSPVDFVLQTAPGIASPIDWANVTTAPTVVGGQNRWTNQATNPSRLYRLRRDL